MIFFQVQFRLRDWLFHTENSPSGPSCFKNPLKNLSKSFGRFSNSFIQVHNFRSSLSSALHSRSSLTHCILQIEPASCQHPHHRCAAHLPHILLFWIAKNIVFRPRHSVYRAYSPTKKVGTFNQSELSIYVT